MKVVVQRVTHGAVKAGGETVGEIGRGFVILLGVGSDDTPAEAEWLAGKCAGLRVFEDDQGLMNLGLADVEGNVLVVSQFTLYADCEKGRRPSFASAAPPDKAEELYEVFVRALRDRGITVSTGRFGAKMMVEIANDGPVTLILERGH
jgi:D-tyrosyl-tRNA(Tyr) deacylase